MTGADEGPEHVEETAGEEGESTGGGRASAVALSAIAAVAAWRIIVTFPELAYVVVGILGTIGVQKLRARRAGRGGGEPDPEPERPDIAAALQHLIGDDRGVLLTRLRNHLHLPDTKTVKQLLDEAGIPWKPGRTRDGNGPSVRREDIPPASSPGADAAHGEGCCCRSGDNGNSGNGPGAGLGEGIRVQAIGEGGRVLSGNLPDGESPADRIRALEALADRQLAVIDRLLAEKRVRGEVSD